MKVLTFALAGRQSLNFTATQYARACELVHTVKQSSFSRQIRQTNTLDMLDRQPCCKSTSDVAG